MELTEAADAIRDKLIEHRISQRANLWSTILNQIRKEDAFSMGNTQIRSWRSSACS